ncbi:TetR/AcrR family transcriptional regulator [Sphingobium tyrosinilyticum]|uniref:TetR/AcrR family transcriptional regulator n=1 Tax=Sphingobium tyrosinilyticum TaxID=2715436 RepID=A0ABV9F6M8_9SPHN
MEEMEKSSKLNGVMSKRGGTQATQRARAEETRTVLLQTGRRMFGEIGFHGSGTVALVKQAKVTSGALYHHFPDKKALFEAVFLDVLIELQGAAEAEARNKLTRWDRILSAFDNYLSMVESSREFQQIVLIEGPAVLGWVHWRDLVSKHVTARITKTLHLLMEDGAIEEQPAEPIANLLQGALNEAALSIAHAPNPHRAKTDVSSAFKRMLAGLRC